jgi:hypothetical protein
MIFARVLVGVAAAAICIAGIGWYAVFLFGPDPRRPSTKTAPAAAPTLHPDYERRQDRRAVTLGLVAVSGALLLAPEAFDSIRTGVPVHTLHGPDMNGWIVLAGIVFVIGLGAWLAVSALLKMWSARRHL